MLKTSDLMEERFILTLVSRAFRPIFLQPDVCSNNGNHHVAFQDGGVRGGENNNKNHHVAFQDSGGGWRRQIASAVFSGCCYKMPESEWLIGWQVGWWLVFLVLRHTQEPVYAR